MNKFGIQYLGGSPEGSSENTKYVKGSMEDCNQVKDVLRKFQQGYTERDLGKVDSFTEELFLDREDTSILGTSTGEMLLGIDKVKELLKGDWEYWGDLNIDCENPNISIDGDVAWISTKGSVKYTFEDTPERYDRYVDFIRDKANDTELTPKERITFINWVLTLNYHQREGTKREYLWPMGLSGVLLQTEGKWRISHLHFSIVKSNFPDERFESSKEFIDSYSEQKTIMGEYKNNQITWDIGRFIKNFEIEVVGKEGISEEIVNKYFGTDSMPYVIGTENQWHYGIDQIRKFFTESDMCNLSLDVEHVIGAESGKITWVTVTGLLKQTFTEEELIKRSLDELGNLFQSHSTSKEKLFAAQRSIAYVLKECATGSNYTCPIRMTAVITNGEDGPVFNCIHFSFPFYWIFEGKIDGIQIKDRQ